MFETRTPSIILSSTVSNKSILHTYCSSLISNVNAWNLLPIFSTATWKLHWINKRSLLVWLPMGLISGLTKWVKYPIWLTKSCLLLQTASYVLKRYMNPMTVWAMRWQNCPFSGTIISMTRSIHRLTGRNSRRNFLLSVHAICQNTLAWKKALASTRWWQTMYRSTFAFLVRMTMKAIMSLTCYTITPWIFSQ